MLPPLIPRPDSSSAWMCHSLLQAGESVLPYMCLADKVSWPGSTTRLDVLYTPENTLSDFQALCKEKTCATTS